MVESGGGGVLPECLALSVGMYSQYYRNGKIFLWLFIVLHIMYIKLSLATFYLILMTFQCKTGQKWYSLV